MTTSPHRLKQRLGVLASIKHDIDGVEEPTDAAYDLAVRLIDELSHSGHSFKITPSVDGGYAFETDTPLTFRGHVDVWLIECLNDGRVRHVCTAEVCETCDAK